MTTIKLKSGREWEWHLVADYYVRYELQFNGGWPDAHIYWTGEIQMCGNWVIDLVPDLPELIAHAKTILKDGVK